MHTIQESGIVSHDMREGLKQVAGLQQHVHALIDVANKHHGCGCRLLFLATGEGTGRHIVLHDLYAVLILKVDTSDLVKGYAIPQAHQADLLGGHIVEEVGHGGLTAGNQNRVR